MTDRGDSSRSGKALRLIRAIFGARKPDTGRPVISLIPLPDSVIRLICVFLVVPIPSRGVGDFDYDAPRTFAQQDLARLMRVNKQLYTLVGPVLYANIITTDIPRLFKGALPGDKRCKSMPKSKRQLLAYCRRLYLESPKDLLNEHMAANIRDPTKEATKCLNSLVKVFCAVKDSGGLRYFFPRLESLATSAFTSTTLSRHGDIWWTRKIAWAGPAWLDLVETLDVPVRCSTIGRSYPFQGFHDVYPFWRDTTRFPRRSVPLPPPGQPMQVHYMHFDHISVHPFLPLNVKVVYLYSYYHKRAARIRTELCESLSRRIRRCLDHLENINEANQAGQLQLDVEIRIPDTCLDFFSQLTYGSAKAMRAMVESIDGMLKDVLAWYDQEPRKHRRTKDTWRIRITDRLEGCPICTLPTEVQRRNEKPVRTLLEQRVVWQRKASLGNEFS